ncbi:Zinc finger, RING-type [Corchorus olitorius]|uniref:Zinc finger, RING-type n=1 Tax=Corchorus olitorius TaxID=93759 RepID=A0A1R3IJ11_9ROSI|nr:Zinc finger, RING-type [Corchorus olitorius]
MVALYQSATSQLQSLAVFASLKKTQSQKNSSVPHKTSPRFCSCGRRHFLEATASAALLPIFPSNASQSNDYLDLLNRIHPPRPDWYEEFYASVMDTSMKSYEAEIAGYKSQIFGELRGKAKRVLEIGIGTGPNLEYYADNNEVQVFGVDPNKKMEKYARAAAAAVGLPPKNFQFIEAVAEAVPLDDASVDAVVGTLVLCSVKDVNMALKEVKRVLKPGGLFLFVEHVAAKGMKSEFPTETQQIKQIVSALINIVVNHADFSLILALAVADGTILKFLQSVLDPLQQTVADGCHLTRETGKYISAAGFSNVELNMWTPPAIQEITVDDYESATRRDRVGGHLSFASTVEGISTNADSGFSTSSHSDSSESEPMVKQSSSSHRNFSSRRCFMSKPIHPLSFPIGTPMTEASDSAAAGFSDDAATPQRDAHRWSSASSSNNDFTDVSELFESEFCGRSCIPPEGFKCGLCERSLSQRSPWSSRRIVRSSDMPVAGVLSCRHVFHAECLEQTTPKTRKNDPPCPLCTRAEEQNSPENRVFSRFRNGFPRLRPFSEDGTSKPWGCAQVGDCVEGALHAPPRNTMLLLNRSRMKKNLFIKGNSSKEFPGKLRKSGSSSLQLFGGKSFDQGAVECSKTIAGPSMKR